jgi:homoserine kinase type II
MAVYTEITDSDLDQFMAAYDLGRAVSCKGIAEGIENTNYLVQTEDRRFILTLYEKRVHKQDLPFFLGLMAHLADKGMPCAVPIAGRDGESLRELCGRPAALVTFLDGVWPRNPGPVHCDHLGRAMAHMHLAGDDFELQRKNDLSLEGWQGLFDVCGANANRLQKGLRTKIRHELSALSEVWPSDLPAGVIHADLFPDNVFFLDQKLSGLIDFYFACNDFLSYDLAVALNAWCFNQKDELLLENAAALIAGYGTVREITSAEISALPILARGAALRFFLTRLQDWPDGGLRGKAETKEPLQFWRRLEVHRALSGAGDYGLS